MTTCRRLVRNRWIAAMALVVAALLTRMMIPIGYMPMVENGRLAIVPCAEQNPGIAFMSGMPGMAHMDGMHTGVGHPGDHGVPDRDKNGSCGFGGLSLASLAGADPVLLALAILFITATVFRRLQAPPIAFARCLWPPWTGPPLRV